ncbi:MAG: N-acyl-D-amino-acid deacylase family protein [Bryobacteraceae bacterium]
MILLRGGTLYDGSGREPVVSDVLIMDGVIGDLGRIDPPAGARIVDCTGLAVTPGFVDAHSHSDLQVLEDRPEKIRQGVTSEVVGNCGFSAFPAPADPAPLQDFANGIFRGGRDWGWPDAASYLAAARKSSVHVASLAGHGSLRIAHAGHRTRPLDADQLDAVERSLNEALEQGACGLSTGLMYAPGSTAPREEIERLCRVVAGHGRLCATHMRDYSSRLVEAVDEQIGLARRTGCRVQISHMQAAGRRHWERFAPALERIEKAAADGCDIAFDCYPYAAGSTVLTQLLPSWTMDGGIDGLMRRLADGTQRRSIADETGRGMQLDWDEIQISSVDSGANRALIGSTLAAIAANRKRDAVDVALDLLAEERGAVNIIEFCQSETNLRAAIRHPLSMVISDGFYVRGRPHPRLAGTFPRLLGEICRERRWLPLSEALRKITDAPARRFGLDRRGRLERGWRADVTVFDPRTVGSPATYEEPELAPVGICHVFRHGRPINVACERNENA